MARAEAAAKELYYTKTDYCDVCGGDHHEALLMLCENAWTPDDAEELLQEQGAASAEALAGVYDALRRGKKPEGRCFGSSHSYCCGYVTVPEGDWFCDECLRQQPDFVQVEDKKDWAREKVKGLISSFQRSLSLSSATTKEIDEDDHHDDGGIAAALEYAEECDDIALVLKKEAKNRFEGRELWDEEFQQIREVAKREDDASGDGGENDGSRSSVSESQFVSLLGLSKGSQNGSVVDRNDSGSDSSDGSDDGKKNIDSGAVLGDDAEEYDGTGDQKRGKKRSAQGAVKRKKVAAAPAPAPASAHNSSKLGEGLPVLALDNAGKVVMELSSQKAVPQKLGVCQSPMKMFVSASRGQVTAGGYSISSKDLEPILQQARSGVPESSRPVLLFDDCGHVLQEFASFERAAKDLQLPEATVGLIVRGVQQQRGDRCFLRFKEDTLQNLALQLNSGLPSLTEDIFCLSALPARSGRFVCVKMSNGPVELLESITHPAHQQPQADGSQEGRRRFLSFGDVVSCLRDITPDLIAQWKSYVKQDEQHHQLSSSSLPSSQLEKGVSLDEIVSGAKHCDEVLAAHGGEWLRIILPTSGLRYVPTIDPQQRHFPPTEAATSSSAEVWFREIMPGQSVEDVMTPQEVQLFRQSQGGFSALTEAAAPAAMGDALIRHL